jgi:hypothetical protein
MREREKTKNSSVNIFGVKEDTGSKYRTNNSNTLYHLSQIAFFGAQLCRFITLPQKSAMSVLQ